MLQGSCRCFQHDFTAIAGPISGDESLGHPARQDLERRPGFPIGR